MGYIAALFTYLFYPSVKIHGNIFDQQKQPISSVVVVAEYSDFQVDGFGHAKKKTKSRKSGAYRLRLKRGSNEYPIKISVLSGKDTIIVQEVKEIKRRTTVDLLMK
ncbi:MAG: hypothetical protein ACJ77K_13025 [Bacteroidia bacterium]